MSTATDRTMRAVVVEMLGGPEVLAVRGDWPAPRPGAGELAITVHAAGVNFADVMSRRSGYLGTTPPFVPGLEVAGTVSAVGGGVRAFSIGDRVCAVTLSGGYAEVALARAETTFPLPKEVDWAVGSALAIVVPSAYALLHPLGRVRADDRVLVNSAAGGTGMILGQMAKHAGARQVTGIVSTQAKVAVAAGYGFDEVLTTAEAGTLADASFDIVLEAVGGPDRELARRLTAPFGRLLLYGNSGGTPEPPLTAASLRNDNILAGGMSVTTLARTQPELLRQITAKAFSLVAGDSVTVDVRHALGLSDAAEAHRLVESRESTGKVVLELR